MKRFIITGAPGAGKTEIIRNLERDGFAVVEEAATDVIAAEQTRGNPEHWRHPSFIDAIVTLQRDRQMLAPATSAGIQFHDRCVVCTAALARYLGYPYSPALLSELDRVRAEAIFERRVFFIRNLGFVTPTAARRITFEETLLFEQIHEETYREYGYELFHIERGTVAERAAAIKAALGFSTSA
jgi:predicted ATPase